MIGCAPIPLLALLAGVVASPISCSKPEAFAAVQPPAAVASQHDVPQDPVPAAPTQPTRVARPKLVVLFSIDQLATWVFDECKPHFAKDGGFQRLLDSGVHFGECAFAHACTETGPGHATIGTGVPALVHGIVKNEWYDRDLKAKVYCSGDANAAALAPFPEGKGRSAARMLVPTVGDLLQTADARAKVVAVAHKDRSAILMAGNKADVVVWCETSTGRFVTNATWGNAPQWLLEFDAKKPMDAFFGWTWDRIGPASAYDGLVDDRAFEAPHATTKARTLPAVIRGGGDAVRPAFYTEAFVSPISNEAVLQCAIAALRGEQLGKDEFADLLCVSFSALDTVGHYFGPDSVEARDTLLRIDLLLASFFAVLDEHVGAGMWAIALTADHGVGLPPEVAKERGLGGGRGLLHTQCKAAAEQALRREFGVEGGAPFVAHAGEWSLVLDRARIAEARGERSADEAFRRACEVAAMACSRAPGIERGYARHEVEGRTADDNLQIRSLAFAAHERAGDVLIVAKPYWLEPSLPASHGTPHDYDRRVPLLAMGPMLQRGVVCADACTPGLAAVYAAWWLGLETPAASIDALPQSAMAK